MKLKLSIILSVLSLSVFGAVPIPDDRRADWIPSVTIGISNGIPTDYTVWTNLATAGADLTGVTSCSTLVENLLNSAPRKSIIEAPTGLYLIGTRISKNATTNHVILRGTGASRTNATFVATNGFLIMDSVNYLAFNVHSNLVKGQSNFNILPNAFGDASAYVGRNYRIDVNNYTTNANVIEILGGDRMMLQYGQIIAVSNGTNITIWPPLIRNFSTNSIPLFYANASDQSEFVGFENITITGTNSLTGTGPNPANNTLSIFGSRNWWLKNCRFDNFGGFGINFAYGCRLEVRHSDFVTILSGANTACMISSGHSSDYFLDNYSYGGSPQLEYNKSSGSVVAYGYATNSVSNDYHVGNPFDNHQPHTHLNLWEGNAGEMFQSDSYFGSSDRQTLFRNFFRGYDPIKTGIPRCVDLGRWSQFYNIVGNVLGDTRRSTPWYFAGTNRYASTYPDTQPVVYRFGFPFPGNTAYGYSSPSILAQTPGVNWNDPGRTNYSGPITSATANTDTLTGDFSNILDGDYLLFQSAADTNLYYHFATNFSYLRASGNGTGSGLTLNKAVWSTNGDRVVRIGDGLYFYNALTIQYTNDFLTEGNWDDTNDVQVGTYFTTNTYHLTGGGITKPSWWVGADGNPLSDSSWPPVNPADGSHTVWPAQARNEGINGEAVNITTGNKGKRTGPRGPQRR